MSLEGLKGFPKRIQKALQDGKSDYAIRLFQDEKYYSEVRDNSWDLIPVVTEHLTRLDSQSNPQLFNGCKQMLNQISEVSNPEEVLLQLVSEVEEASDIFKFVTLLDPLYQVIRRITKKKVTSLAWSFNAIQSYLLKACDIPQYDKNLEGKEKLLMDNTEEVLNILRLYSEVLFFYEKCLVSLELDLEVVSVLRKFLVQLLGPPLCYLSMEKFDNHQTEALILAEDIVKKVFKVMNDPLILVEMQRNFDGCTTPSPLSVANLFYLVFCETICYEFIPKVYRCEYVIDSCISVLNNLLEVDNNILTERALMLGNCLITSLGTHKLSYLLLDNPAHAQCFNLLSRVIVYDTQESVRKFALSVFSKYLSSFETRGIYLVMLHLFSSLTHSGLKGYIITVYKDMINSALIQKSPEISPYLQGPKLFALMKKFCHLSDQEKTDLLETSDQIVSSLNLIRFLTLADTSNKTEFREFVPVLTSSFLEPLRKGLELSQAHYKLEIKNTKEAPIKEKLQSEVSVTVSGVQLGEMQLQEKLKFLHSSVTALDVIDSLLSRVVELLDSRL